MTDNTEVFQLDKSNYPTREIIKVIGVGGAGNNALNHIIRGGVSGVEFIAVNTDIAHLELSESQNRMVLGKELTKGLGAGSNPEIGSRAAHESRDDIRTAVEGADMVFLAAGMGGGTGTGAAPVIAQIAHEAGALVIGVVTLPFSFEGKRRVLQALRGVEELKDKVDALIVIPNDKLLDAENTKVLINDAFSRADGVLHQAVQGVTDLIIRPGIVNVDFADVRTVMSNAGPAIMGIGEGYGENRAEIAARNAINNPLMDTRMDGAKGILINITGSNVRIHEVNEATKIITGAADEDAYIIWGHVFDPDMDDTIQITVIATGFDKMPDYTASFKQYQRSIAQHASIKETERSVVTQSVKYATENNIAHTQPTRSVYRNLSDEVPANLSSKVRPLSETAWPNRTDNPTEENIAVTGQYRKHTEEQPIPRHEQNENTTSFSTLFNDAANNPDSLDAPSFLRRRLAKQEKE